MFEPRADLPAKDVRILSDAMEGKTLRFFIRKGVPTGAAVAAPVLRTGCSALPSWRELLVIARRACSSTSRHYPGAAGALETRGRLLGGGGR